MDVEGIKTYADFDVIEFINGEGSYCALLGVVWANNSMAFINFNLVDDEFWEPRH